MRRIITDKFFVGELDMLIWKNLILNFKIVKLVMKRNRGM